MSFDLETYVPEINEKLVPAWLRKLKKLGLRCQFHPDFDPNTWKGLFFPVSVSFDSTPTHAHAALIQKGFQTWICGFDLDVSDFDPANEPIDGASGKSANAILKSKYRFNFQTKSGRSVLDLTLQSYAAATLAYVARGALFDPQSGQFFTGDAAIDFAKRNSAMYQTSSLEPEAWCFQQFGGWKALEEDNSGDPKPPAFADLVNDVGEMQLKNVVWETGLRYFSGDTGYGNSPMLVASARGLTVVGRGCFKTFRPAQMEDAIKEYKALLKKCGFRLSSDCGH